MRVVGHDKGTSNEEVLEKLNCSSCSLVYGGKVAQRRTS